MEVQVTKLSNIDKKGNVIDEELVGLLATDTIKYISVTHQVKHPTTGQLIEQQGIISRCTVFWEHPRIPQVEDLNDLFWLEHFASDDEEDEEEDFIEGEEGEEDPPGLEA